MTNINGERILQESKVLLKQSHWKVTKITFSLAFAEDAHFNHFLNKHTELNHIKFRNI